ncbi:hypothetical protein [Aureispira sp. CCB-E]|uniref:hypothetical protein n=1 Tax=Aureispira sp. CCB-E TaxID=3051121 RepID=UPI0028689CF5|nr:hypothetical protein [Aureispira sp. CCB-E]WMX16234.1 hypothetical protein QP953_07635 [Aureispira sp. CCB-E]
MNNLNLVIEGYRKFLNASWEAFEEQTLAFSHDTEEDQNNWLQANWEILVESNVCDWDEYLEEYGNGADCNVNSDRVTKPKAKATHSIICSSKDNNLVTDFFTKEKVLLDEMSFSKFISVKNNKYTDQPPFDWVLLENGNEFSIIELNKVVFKKVIKVS